MVCGSNLSAYIFCKVNKHYNVFGYFCIPICLLYWMWLQRQKAEFCALKLCCRNWILYMHFFQAFTFILSFSSSCLSFIKYVHEIGANFDITVVITVVIIVEKNGKNILEKALFCKYSQNNSWI